MNKQNRYINLIKRHGGFYTLVLAGLAVATDPSVAMAFDVVAAGNAMANPIVGLVEAHWGKAVTVLSAAGMVMVPGDLKTKAMGMMAGALLAGVGMVVIKTGFGMGAGARAVAAVVGVA